MGYQICFQCYTSIYSVAIVAVVFVWLHFLWFLCHFFHNIFFLLIFVFELDTEPSAPSTYQWLQLSTNRSMVMMHQYQ
jgi:hypothetical protein